MLEENLSGKKSKKKDPKEQAEREKRRIHPKARQMKKILRSTPGEKRGSKMKKKLQT